MLIVVTGLAAVLSLLSRYRRAHAAERDRLEDAVDLDAVHDDLASVARSGIRG